MAVIIFSYTSSPQVKISQKVLGGYFFDSHCIARLTMKPDQPRLTIAVDYSCCNETRLVSVFHEIS